MLKKSNTLAGSFYLEWVLFVIVIVLIFTSWKQVINKELEAQSISIDRNVTQGSDNDKSTGLMLTKSGDKPPGASGYSPEGLGQPCQQNPGKEIVPNLPGSHKQQACDSTLGLVCIHGLVEGGGICLKNINQECSARGECTPLADGCFYGFCQQYGDVINKPCSNNFECTGNGKFNHVCDPVLRRCVFDIFPNDSGCALSQQCKFYTSDARATNQSGCLNQKPIVKYFSSYDGNDIFNITGTTILKKDYYISITSESKGFLGRYLISSIDIIDGDTKVKLSSYTHNEDSGSIFTIELGNPEGGICLINFPLGTKRTPVLEENPDVLFPCEDSLDELNGFCVEKGRTNVKGTIGQVCLVQDDGSKPLDCQDGLTCTFIEEFNSKLRSNFNATGSGSELKIGSTFVNDIGKCARQVAISRETCDDANKACKTPNICLKQKIVGSKGFSRYCGRLWDTFETSTLLGCPNDYTLNNRNECLADNKYICINNSDCLDNNCGTDSKGLTSYNFTKGIFEKYSFAQNAPQGSKILMSKNFDSDNVTPSAAGYYYFNNNTLTININTNNGKSLRTKVITFEDTSIQNPTVSVIKKSNGDHQLNVIYKQTYKNYTRREYFFKEFGGKMTSDFALTQGASIYFESNGGGTTPVGVFELDYDNVTDSGSTATINSLNVIEGGTAASNFYQNTIKNNRIYYKLISYDSGYKFNKNQTKSPLVLMSSNTNINSATVEFPYLNLYPGTSMTFFSNDTTTVQYFDGSTPIPSLVNEKDYYNINNDRNATELILTDTSNKVYGGGVTINGKNVTSSEVSVNITTGNFSADSGFLQLPEMSGINIFTIEVKDTDPLGTTKITIKKRKELYSPYYNVTNVQYNYPVGFFIPKDSEVDVHVEESEIILTTKIDKLNHQVTQINYNITLDFSTNYQYGKGKALGTSKIEYEVFKPNSTSFEAFNIYTNFEITNIYTLPNPKIYSTSGYSTIDDNDEINFSYPFEIDNVKKYIYQSQRDNSTINIMSMYKNIQPESAYSSIEYDKINIGNETTMRKTKVSNWEHGIEYTGITPTTSTPEVPQLNINPIPETFGYCTPIEISKLETIRVSKNTKTNYFVPGEPFLYIKNISDIDVILKYSSSELVIGIHTNQKNTNKTPVLKSVPDRYIGIIGIKEYIIDEKFQETLVLSTNTYMDSTLISGSNAYLFVNNIVPVIPTSISDSISGKTANFPDGTLIITSCLDSPGKYFNGLTGYNRIYTTTTNINGSQFYNIRLGEDSTFNNIYFTDSWEPTSNSNNFTGSNFQLIGTKNQNPSYLVNNLFLSSLSLQQPYITGTVTRNIVDRVLWPSVMRKKGDYCLFVDTIPFYNGFSNGIQGSLDLTYKTPIYWSYWITELNNSPIEIVKIINNFNPGNIENNMFYYALAKIQGDPYLLLLSNNFNLNNIAESEPIPVKLPNDFTSSIGDQFFMTPYNQKLNYLTSFCSS